MFATVFQKIVLPNDELLPSKKVSNFNPEIKLEN